MMAGEGRGEEEEKCSPVMARIEAAHERLEERIAAMFNNQQRSLTSAVVEALAGQNVMARPNSNDSPVQEPQRAHRASGDGAMMRPAETLASQNTGRSCMPVETSRASCRQPVDAARSLSSPHRSDQFRASQNLRMGSTATMSSSMNSSVGRTSEWMVVSLSQKQNDFSMLRKTVLRSVRSGRSSSNFDLNGQGPGGCCQALRSLAANIKNRWAFETVVMVFIAANAAFMGVNAEMSIQSPGKEEEPYIHYLDWLFVCFFALELLIRMLAEGWEFFRPHSNAFSWNMFDTFLVVVTLLNEVNPFGLDLKLVRALRPVRLVHLVRLIRFASCFKELRIMVAGLMNCGRTLCWSMLLLALASYIYAVFCLTVSSDWLASLDGEPERYGSNTLSTVQTVNYHFSSLPWSCYTLFKAVSGGLDWGDDLADDLTYIGVWLPASFMLYIVVTVLCLLNVITAAFVDAATRRSVDDEEHILDFIQQREERVGKLTELFNRHDLDKDGNLDLQEFQAAAKDWRTQSYFKELAFDFDPQQSKYMFKLFDSDRSGSININEFIQGVHNLRGNARSLDMFREFQILNKKVDRALKRMEQCTSIAIQCAPTTPHPPQYLRPSSQRSTDGAPVFSHEPTLGSIGQSSYGVVEPGESEYDLRADTGPDAVIVEGI